METENEISGPIVFQCKQCHRILCDSFSLTCTDQELKSITFKAVNHIRISTELDTSTSGPDRGSTFNKLYCNDCNLEVGRMYLTTSKRLDQHRDLFSLSIDQLDAYVLGSAPITTENLNNESITEPAVAIFGYDAERALNILDVLRKMEQIIIHQNERLNQLEQLLNSI